MSSNKDFRFNDIPMVAIVLGFIFFWPAGLVMLMLKIFGDSGSASQNKQKGSGSPRAQAPSVGTGATPPPPPQRPAPARQSAQSATPLSSVAPPPPPPVSDKVQPQQVQGSTPPRPVTHGPVQPKPAVPSAKKEEAAKPTAAQQAISSSGYTAMLVIGSLMAAAGFLSITFVIVGTLASTGMLSSLANINMLIFVALMFVLLCIPGIILMVWGGKLRASSLRYKRYLSIMGANKVVSIDHLAYLLSTNYKTACNDLQAMMDKGYIKGAFIDWDERELIFGNPFELKRKPKTVIKADGDISPADEIKRINSQISDKDISAKLDRMEEITRRIFEYIDARPDQIGRIKNFTGYYLPMTMKILNAYVRFEKQNVAGANIQNTMRDIEEILDTLVKGFENQLDSLFMDEALDVSSDISVLESMLTKEGLTGSGFDLRNLYN
ncbi:MAG: 5-bromo-4-chloroindolyl phosphate hydrolysis family protein [Christensenellales bacterium]|jgi:hypothetical protein